MIARHAAVIALLGLLALGCGGVTSHADGGADTGGQVGGVCGDFLACDGNVVGTWKSDPRCLPPTTIQGGGCAGEAYDATKVAIESTWTFRADLTMALSLTAAGPVTVKAPEACLVSGGAPVACADAGAFYAGRITFIGGTVVGGPCQSQAGVCTCSLSIVAAPAEGGGTYSVAGSALTFQIGAQSTTSDYCASPTTLQLRQRNTTGAPKIGVYLRQ